MRHRCEATHNRHVTGFNGRLFFISSQPGGWGDALACTVAIRHLKKRGARVVFAARGGRSNSILASNPDIDYLCEDVYPDPTSHEHFIEDERAIELYDASDYVIDMAPHHMPPPAQYYDERLRLVGIEPRHVPTGEIKPYIYFTPEAEQDAGVFLSAHGLTPDGFVYFHNGGSVPARRWHHAHAQAFAEACAAHRLPVLSVASVDVGERPVTLPGVPTLTDGLNALGRAAVMRRARVVVGTNSANSLIAHALEKPTVLVYNAEVPPEQRTQPYHRQLTLLQSQKFNPHGVMDVSPAQVFDAVLELWGSP